MRQSQNPGQRWPGEQAHRRNARQEASLGRRDFVAPPSAGCPFGFFGMFRLLFGGAGVFAIVSYAIS